MKTKKNVTALIFSLIFICSTSFAQEKLDEFMTKSSPEERAQMQTEYMKENLSLTEKQVALVSDINVIYSKKNAGYLQGGNRKIQTS